MRSGHVHAVVVGSASGVALRGAPSSQLCTSGRFPEIQRQVPVNMDALWLTLERCTVSHRHAPHEAKITWVHIGTQSVSRHVSSMSADRQLHSVRTQRQRAAVRYGPESPGRSTSRPQRRALALGRRHAGARKTGPERSAKPRSRLPAKPALGFRPIQEAPLDEADIITRIISYHNGALPPVAPPLHALAALVAGSSSGRKSSSPA